MSWKLHRIPWINPISSARMPMCTCYLLQYCFKTSRFVAKQQTSLQHQILRHSDWRSMGECRKSCPNPKVSVPFCKQATREVPKREAALLQQQVVLAVKGINVWISSNSSGRSFLTKKSQDFSLWFFPFCFLSAYWVIHNATKNGLETLHFSSETKELWNKTYFCKAFVLRVKLRRRRRRLI